jgi:carbonic anhydrase
MDARLDPISILGLELGDAHLIRNAGGIVTDDVLRSLAVSHWLTGTEEVLVIGHTGCGMLTFDNRSLREQIAREAGGDAREMDFLPFTDPESSVRESLRRVRESSLFRDGYRARGYLYDIHSGELHELAESAQPEE